MYQLDHQVFVPDKGSVLILCQFFQAILMWRQSEKLATLCVLRRWQKWRFLGVSISPNTFGASWHLFQTGNIFLVYFPPFYKVIFLSSSKILKLYRYHKLKPRNTFFTNHHMKSQFLQNNCFLCSSFLFPIMCNKFWLNPRLWTGEDVRYHSSWAINPPKSTCSSPTILDTMESQENQSLWTNLWIDGND